MGHGHHHAHDHAPGHAHAPASFGHAFAIGITLNFLFVCVEATYGIIAHSIALVADAGHNLGDVFGLLLAWGATILARRVPTERRTYGFRRSSILASLLNATLLLVAVGAIAWEAFGRLQRPEPVAIQTVIRVALVGIVINTLTALLFMRGRKHDLNIRGAFLHMAADAAVALGVVIAGLVIATTGWLWLDPLVSIAIAIVITIGTWGLLRQSFNLAMDAVPEGIDRVAVEEYLRQVPSVIEVHDLHIWGMSTTENALTAHLVMPGNEPPDAFLARLRHDLEHQFGIGHVTIQVEHGDEAHPCVQAPDHVV
ncbi:MAG TPA: cation diffusion facilitator family transporter [Candidatus Kapabacteria bacterium]|nr:cation diffusion facilitator family transporter [Candidatus Kapabacteria bacterium]